MIDSHHRYVACHQLGHLRILKIHTGNDHAVKSPVSGMLQIGHLPAPFLVPVDKGDIIIIPFRRFFKAFQYARKIVMGQAAVCFINKQDSQIVASVGLQGPGYGIGKITHFLRRPAD